MDTPSGSRVVIGLMSNRPATIEFPTSPVSSPQSEEEVDYSEEDLNFGYEPPPPDTSKFSQLAVEDIEVTFLDETTLPPTKIP